MSLREASSPSVTAARKGRSRVRWGWLLRGEVVVDDNLGAHGDTKSGPSPRATSTEGFS
jgi:hypothetical protein